MPLGAALLTAQTGKIEGEVRDQAGAPIQGAQILIVGTAFNSLTNAHGYYFINNVPPGTVVMRVMFIGYKWTQVEGLRVRAGQTITQDIQLEASPVQLEDVTVLAAGNPLVPRDEVTTKQRIDGEFTQNLPVDQVGEVLQLQPGVVASPDGTTLSIRGGRADEAAYYLDGVSIQPGNRGSGLAAAGTNSTAFSSPSGGTLGASGSTVRSPNPGAIDVSNAGVTVASNGFEEVSVTTGAASAQFGNAQAGIVNISTRTGGNKFAARLAAETDAVFGKTLGMGYNRFEANVSGPMGVKGLTFNLAGAAEGNLSVRPGKGRQDFPVFVSTGVDTVVANPDSVGSTTTTNVNVNQYSIYTGSCSAFANNSDPGIASNNGQPCHGARLPNASFSAYQWTANINLSYGNGSRLRIGGSFSQNQGKNFVFGRELNPGIAANQQTGFRAQNAAWIASWTQNLAKSAERALALDVNLSYQTDRFIESPFADGGPGTGTLGFYFSPIPLQYGFSVLDARYDVNGNEDPSGVYSKLDCFIRNIASCLGVIPLNNADSVGAHVPTTVYRSNPYGLQTTTFADGGLSDARLQLYSENRWVANASLDWQLDRYNRIQVGGEFVHYDMVSYSARIPNESFEDYWAEKPVRYAAFIQDRLDIGDVVVQLGLRYDYFDTRASRWSGYPRISTNPALDTLPPGTDPTVLYVPDQPFDYLSPRLQVAFPVTERTNFRLSYAQSVQTPDFALVLGGINSDISATGPFVYGQNVDYGKSFIFEFGIQHAFSDDMVLDISAYNRDNLANAAARLVTARDPLTGNNTDLSMLTNADFGNAKGIDLRLNRRFGQLFNGTLGYSYTSAASTGSDPYTYLAFGNVVNRVTGGTQPPPQAIAPTALSRPHNLVGSLALTFPDRWNAGTTIGAILQNFQVFAVFRFASGTAYTACASANGNQGVRSGDGCNQGRLQGGLNTVRLPMFKQFDLRFVKGVNLGRGQLSMYLDARNILNFTNVLTQYVVTRSITSQLEQQDQFSSDSSLYASEAAQNGVYLPDGSLNLTFGGAGRSGCSEWVNLGNMPSVPNCIYLLRAEQRWGNGDGIFTLAEQLRASSALYYTAGAAPTYFYGAGSQLRLGVEFTF